MNTPLPKVLIRFRSRRNTLYCRITVNTVRCKNDFSVHLKIKPPVSLKCIKEGEWDSKKQRVKGDSLDAKMVNYKLENIVQTIKQFAHELNVIKKNFTADILKRLYTGEDKTSYTFIEASEKHIAHLQQMPTDEIAAGTIKSYRSRNKNVVEFLKAKNYTHIQCHEFTPLIAQQFLSYMRTERELKVSQTFAAKNVDLIRKVIKFSINQGWNQFNPLQAFVNRKGKHKMPPYLSIGECRMLEEKTLTSQRLQRVKDIFVFCCHTGLSFTDVRAFRASQHLTFSNGRVWLEMHRLKTGVDFIVPVTVVAQDILSRYGGEQLPVLSNVKFNAHLKEIQHLCGISINLTVRVARTTFGVIMLNDKGASLDSVSKMLGHVNTRITEKHYTTVLKKKIVREVVMNNPLLYEAMTITPPPTIKVQPMAGFRAVRPVVIELE